MYLDMGQLGAAQSREIIGIFDLDTATAGAHTRRCLQAAKACGILRECEGEMPRSLVLCGGAIYISSVSARAFARRAQQHKKELQHE